RALEQLEQALQQECPYVVVVVGEGVSTEAEGVAAMRRVDQRALLLFLVSPEAQAASSLQGVMRPGELLLPTPLFRPQAIHLLDHLCGYWYQQRKAAFAQQQTEETLESVLESMDESVLVADQQGLLLYVNRAAIQLLGGRRQEMIATPLPTIQRLLKYEPTPSQGEITIDNYKGKRLPVHYAYRYWGSLRGEGNEVQSEEKQQRRVLILQDRSHQARVGAREQYAAFQSGVAEMSANILHHVGNTIQSTLSSFGELSQNVDELKRLQEALLRGQQKATAGSGIPMEKVTRALAHLGEEMDYSRQRVNKGLDQIVASIRILQQGPKLQGGTHRFSLSQLVDDLLILSAGDLRSRKIRVVKEVDGALSEVRLPRNRLLHVLTLLMKNSMEAIEERIQCGSLKPGMGEIWIKANQQGDHFTIEIEDNGDGIDPSIEKKIMHYGFTTKYNNQGFGLHLAGNFAKDMRGG
ncbi:MAG: PAS domain-containing protein, partial [Gammaproteobacteria bacterium]|nr:PAS domain-containing protein [Gammaproteobacteria bacterium]